MFSEGPPPPIPIIPANRKVPEPFALSLFGIGLAGAAGLSRRKLAKAQSIIFESAAPDDGACDFVSEADPALLQARPRSPLSD